MSELFGHRDRLKIIYLKREKVAAPSKWMVKKQTNRKTKKCGIDLDKVAGRTDKLKKF